MAIFNSNGKPKLINVDLDNTLTDGTPFWKDRPQPHHGMIDLVRKLYEGGNHIIIWTARAWMYAPETVGWLIEHNVPFHGVYMQKGGSDLYLDDKAIRVDSTLTEEKVWDILNGKV